MMSVFYQHTNEGPCFIIKLRHYMSNIVVKKIKYGDPELEQALVIRRRVFVDEQHCPPDLEYANDDVSTHFLAMLNGQPCGAARWRKTANGFKLERFAVLPEFRGKGIGANLLQAVLKDLPSLTEKIYLNAQLSAVDFYRPFGFVPVGDEFDEAGIRHRQMLFSARS
jgi:predicted GNAT family N-acyltransferase